MVKSYVDAYLYAPDRPAGKERLVELVGLEKRVTEGVLGRSEFVVAKELHDSNGKPIYFSLGKDIKVPFGAATQPRGVQNVLWGLDYIFAVLVDSLDTGDDSYKSSVEAVVSEGCGVDFSQFKCLGLYSGEHGKRIKPC